MDTLPPDTASLVRSRRMLLAEGWTDRMLASARSRGQLRTVRRGWYAAAEQWDALWPEEQHRAQSIAVVRDAQSSLPLSYISAAVVHELPLYRVTSTRVHLTSDVPDRISSGSDVFRHCEPLAIDDVQSVGGLLCTSLERTTFDLIRTLPLEAAVCVADAAERKASLGRDGWDDLARVRWRRELSRRIGAASGARGIRQARFVAEFADGRAQLPGESVSRLQLYRLGFASPRLQVPIVAPDRGLYYVDFALDEVRCFAEFDGEGKYRDEALRAGKSVEDVVLAEKQREDWIRGRTQWRFVRWGMPHIRTPRLLAQRLESFGVIAP